MQQSDPSIILGVKPAQLNDPLDTYSKAQGIAQNALALQSAQRSEQENQQFKQLLNTPGVNLDSPEFTQAVYRINPKLGVELEKARVTNKTAQINAQKEGYGVFQNMTGVLLQDPSDSSIDRVAAQAQSLGLSHPDQINQLATNLKAIPTPQGRIKAIELWRASPDTGFNNANPTTYQQQSLAQNENQFNQTQGLAQAKFQDAQQNQQFNQGIAAKNQDLAQQKFQQERGNLPPAERPASIVSDAVAQMKEGYDRLYANGAIRSEKAGAVQNFAAAVGSSGVGQAASSFLDQKNQSIRDFVKAQRGVLVQAIKQANNMSAKEMDSNAELQNMISMATSPEFGYESNVTALNLIEKRYGISAVRAATPSASAASVSPIDALLDKYK